VNLEKANSSGLRHLVNGAVEIVSARVRDRKRSSINCVLQGENDDPNGKRNAGLDDARLPGQKSFAIQKNKIP